MAEGHARGWEDAAPANKPGAVERCEAFLRRLHQRDAALGRQAAARTSERPPADAPGAEQEAGSLVEQEYAAALASLAAARAGTDVHHFRAAYFGGRVLTEAEARALLASPLARLFGLEHFRAAHVPVVGHRVPVIEAQPARSPSGRMKLRVLGGGRARTLQLDGALYWKTVGTTLVEVPGPPPFMVPRHVPVLPGSVLDGLGRVGAMLARTFLWTPAAGAWFALTGQPPAGPAVVGRLKRGGDGRAANIAVEALAYVGPATVAKLYARLQRLHGGRRPPRRRMRLVGFMVARGAERVTRGLCSEYNRSVAPRDRYKGQDAWRNAARDWWVEVSHLRAVERPLPAPRRRVRR